MTTEQLMKTKIRLTVGFANVYLSTPYFLENSHPGSPITKPMIIPFIDDLSVNFHFSSVD